MASITVDELQRDLVSFLNRVEAGETLLILREDHPVAEVKPVLVPAHGQRPFGLDAGEFKVPADFDDPLPERVVRDFEGT